MKRVGFRESRISQELYFEWRKNRALSALKRVEKNISLQGKKVLEIGCGYGGLSWLLLERGAQVFATEADKKKLQVAQKQLSQNTNFTSLYVTDEKLPFKDACFDCICIFDVIEHVKKPKTTIEESYRTLKQGGLLYVEFTPYYSITGHHLYDFAKWPIHLLPKDKIKKIVFSKKVDSFMSAEYYWQQFESLNKLRIGDFQSMVAKFKKIEERFIIKYPEIFEINLPFINYLGPLKDYLTMSFEGFYRKE